MHRDKGFAPLVIIVVLVVLVMTLAQCDVRYATGATGSVPIQTEGNP